MNASNFPGLALPKAELRSRTKARAERLQASADRTVYDAVNERDGLRCRACGEYAGISGHRHHLLGRVYTTTQDVCVICCDCHELIHVRVGGVRLKVYGNADFRNERGVLSGLTIETRQENGVWNVDVGR